MLSLTVLLSDDESKNTPSNPLFIIVLPLILLPVEVSRYMPSNLFEVIMLPQIVLSLEACT